MVAKVYRNGRLVEIQDEGKTVWSREQELKNVAAAAARGAVKGANGVSGDEQAAADKARKEVKNLLG